jgi:hypothetical protein
MKQIKVTSNNQLKQLVKEAIESHTSTEVLDLNHLDVSEVEDFSNIFERISTTFPIDISEWDVSNGKDFSNMFSYSRFTGDISKWNIPKGAKTINLIRPISTYPLT